MRPTYAACQVLTILIWPKLVELHDKPEKVTCAHHADARQALRLVCIPKALPSGVSVTITCFEAAFDASSIQDGADASSLVTVAGPRSAVCGAGTVLDLQPTQQPGQQQPAARCALTVHTAQQCMAVAALALAVLAQCLQLRPAVVSDGEEVQLLCHVVAELMQHGDGEVQVRLLQIRVDAYPLVYSTLI